MNRVLITGSTGLIGTALASELKSRNISSVGIAKDRIESNVCDEILEGSAADPEIIDKALRGVDTVVHLAALRAPHLGTAAEVYLGNTSATFEVLQRAAEHGVSRIIHISSISVLGFSFAPVLRHPSFLPIDEKHQKDIFDSYGLSKAADEEIVRYINNKFEIPCYALRFPYVGDLKVLLLERARKIYQDDSFAAKDFWSYLEIRDAINAILTFSAETPQVLDPIFNVVAPNTLASKPTSELLKKHYPAIESSRPFLGFDSVFDSSKILSHTSFQFNHLFENMKALNE